MKLIVDERPKDSNECILVNKEYMLNPTTNIFCLKKCATCKYMTTPKEMQERKMAYWSASIEYDN